MSFPEDRGQMRIGEVLKQSRTRQGIEIADVEERTKIRTKYLRALESEEWEVLPSPAYAKGFLRTYAQLLGLDADAIVDEYRRQVESELPAGHPLRLGEPVLEGRRRPGGSGQARWSVGWLVAGGIVAAVGVLLLIGVIGGDDDEGKPADVKTAKEQRKERKQERRREQRRQQRQEQASPPSGQSDSVALGLEIKADVQVCLLGPGKKVLIPGQVLSAGTEEAFEQPRFDLRFPSGYDVEQFTLTLDGKRARLPETTGPAAFEIEPGSKPRPGPVPGAECP